MCLVRFVLNIRFISFMGYLILNHPCRRTAVILFNPPSG